MTQTNKLNIKKTYLRIIKPLPRFLLGMFFILINFAFFGIAFPFLILWVAAIPNGDIVNNGITILKSFHHVEPHLFQATLGFKFITETVDIAFSIFGKENFTEQTINKNIFLKGLYRKFLILATFIGLIILFSALYMAIKYPEKYF